ncbi:lecithin retinol acyltransferase family protein [Ruminococcus difficilis]|uniref:Lecithin retinol acyltransferase family protein n=1 Tax=Ruminococcus difficilis TaxID=2763069 RepID=A0A934WTN4_9FIRM|nr:lecithin retinol acyltransferase family protein [Ruminococcus difficilis]MBK6089752.1 lecithin retinol acyltransferase family protein [Ruminococcus difficilis]
MKWVYRECQYGDIIRVKLGSVYHYGIFASEDEVIAFGLPPTAENLKNQQDIKVLATDIDVFSCGNMIETAQLTLNEKRKRQSPDKTVSAARARIGEGSYNLIHNNCEHFVNEIVFGKKISEQELEVRRKWMRFHENKEGL